MNPLNRLIVRTLPLVPRPVVRLIASRYVAGETLDDALRRVARAERRRVHGDARRARRGRRRPRRDRADGPRIPARARRDRRARPRLEHLRQADGARIEARSRATAGGSSRGSRRPRAGHGIFVRIDMEDSSVTEETIRIYLEFREQYRRSASCSRPTCAAAPRTRGGSRRSRERPRLQGHLRRAAGDRVPGARGDPRQLHGARRGLFGAAVYVGIATHDPILVERALAPIARPGSPARPTSSRCSSASPGPAAPPGRRGPPPPRLRPLRRGLVRVLAPAPQGEPLDRRATSSRGLFVPEAGDGP